MNLSELKKVIEKVAEINLLTPIFYYGEDGIKKILKKYTSGSDINIPKYKVVCGFSGEIANIFYEKIFTRWNFHKKELPSHILDLWINKGEIGKLAPLQNDIDMVENHVNSKYSRDLILESIEEEKNPYDLDDIRVETIEI